ncbi:hypothetical protein MHYP_G00226090 [Metynnis hypsauchen]
MPPKASKQLKEAQLAAANMEDSASFEASQAASDDDLPLMWEKVSNRILKTINESYLELRTSRNYSSLTGPIVPKPPEGAKPRSIIAHVHFYTKKERILRLRGGRNLDYNGHKVLIFPDYTAEVLGQRRSFRDVMQAL